MWRTRRAGPPPLVRRHAAAHLVMECSEGRHGAKTGSFQRPILKPTARGGGAAWPVENRGLAGPPPRRCHARSPECSIQGAGRRNISASNKLLNRDNCALGMRRAGRGGRGSSQLAEGGRRARTHTSRGVQARDAGWFALHLFLGLDLQRVYSDLRGGRVLC